MVKQEYQREAIELGSEAIQSDYYRSESRLDSELDSNRGYRNNLIEICQETILNSTDVHLASKACNIVRKFGRMEN